ncbi:MAG: YXWGXW repeat-containing protein, partial [Terracidiphilus sp.]
MTFRSKLRRLLFATAFAIPVFALAVPQAQAGIFVSVNFAPPALPVYVQPPLPAPGYIWTPGYWAYGDAGYYWVPGVWV